MPSLSALGGEPLLLQPRECVLLLVEIKVLTSVSISELNVSATFSNQSGNDRIAIKPLAFDFNARRAKRKDRSPASSLHAPSSGLHCWHPALP